MHLNARRQSGFAANPIAIEAIIAYFELRQLKGYNLRMEWYRLICMLDGVWSEHQEEKRKAHANTASRH